MKNPEDYTLSEIIYRARVKGDEEALYCGARLLGFMRDWQRESREHDLRIQAVNAMQLREHENSENVSKLTRLRQRQEERRIRYPRFEL